MDSLKVINNFTEDNLPDLDICVLAALELFSKALMPQIRISYKRPLVVGSGNAAATGKILFQDHDSVFADESDFENKLKIKAIDGVVLISASGGQHAPLIAKTAKRNKKKVTLITSNEDALAKQFADTIYVFPKNREPYTYNVSTYLGMILGKTKEDPKKIIRFIKTRVDKIILRKSDRYFLIIPEKFKGIIRMVNIKFMELFGRNIARDIETFEYMKHSTTVVQAKELFISFGKPNRTWGKDRVYIPLPKDADYGAMMAISYYIIGKIQMSHPDWFKKNLKGYTKQISRLFKQNIEPIVEEGVKKR